MSKVKLDLQGKTIPEKIQFARQIKTQMTGNAHFPTPSPALDSIAASATELEDAYNDCENARKTAKSKTAVMYEKEAGLDLALSSLGSYVESTSKGDATLIKSSGLEVRGETIISTTQTSGKVTGLNASSGDNVAEIDLHWDRVSNARAYEIEYCIDPFSSESWVRAGLCTKSHYTVNGLVSAKKYWFRVAAVSTDGEGPWSDPVAKIVL